MGIQSKTGCSRKEVIEKVQRFLNDIDNAKVEGRCCCTDPEHPPEGTKIVSLACLDGKKGLQRKIKVQKEKYLWIPPPVDNRPPLDHNMSCYASTVANQFYDQYAGCRLDCQGTVDGGRGAPHSHWWNKTKGGQGGHQGGRQGPTDYCEDPSFQPPAPLGHQAWTNEPGGTCKYPQYCKAHCFEHSPERDWARH